MAAFFGMAYLAYEAAWDLQYFLIVYACLQYKSKMLPLLIEELAKGQGAAVSKLSEEIYGIGHYVQIFLIGGFYVQIFCSHI